MKIRWSPESAADFAGIIQYIRTQNPSAADRVAHTIYESITSLESFSQRGRPGRVKDTRELVLAPSHSSSCTASNRTSSRLPEYCTAHNAGREWDDHLRVLTYRRGRQLVFLDFPSPTSPSTQRSHFV